MASPDRHGHAESDPLPRSWRGAVTNLIGGSGAVNDSQAILQARDLCRRFGEGEAAVDALVGVTVDFPAGRYAAIMGRRVRASQR